MLYIFRTLLFINLLYFIEHIYSFLFFSLKNFSIFVLKHFSFDRLISQSFHLHNSPLGSVIFIFQMRGLTLTKLNELPVCENDELGLNSDPLTKCCVFLTGCSIGPRRCVPPPGWLQQGNTHGWPGS